MRIHVEFFAKELLRIMMAMMETIWHHRMRGGT